MELGVMPVELEKVSNETGAQMADGLNSKNELPRKSFWAHFSSGIGRVLDRISPKIGRHLRLAMGLSADEAAAQVDVLVSRVAQLERALELVASSPDAVWLYKNRAERMDASVEPLYDPTRRCFHLARYEFAAKYALDRQIADIACGTGYGSALLGQPACASKVMGIDIDAEAVAYANRNHSCERVSFVVASGDATPLADASVDLVVSFETIEHVPDDQRLLKEFHRILKPGGLMICSTPNEWPLEIMEHHLRVYDRRSFEEIISRFFELREMWNQNSGSPWEYNRGQPAGMCRTTAENERLAECYVCVAQKSLQ
jgi:ubiquinone/menaquinone biosynthesis C-methylase UbiE